MKRVQPHPNWSALMPEEQQPWQTLSSVQLAPLPRQLVRDQVRLHGGEVAEYVYRPRGPRAVFVFPVTPAGEGVLIREYRYPLRAHVSAVVAGGAEPGEDLPSAAERELREEVGGKAEQFVALPGFYPQPSISGAAFFAVLALGVALGNPEQESSELIERLVLPLPEIYARLERGEILDGSSSLVLFHARSALDQRGFVTRG